MLIFFLSVGFLVLGSALKSHADVEYAKDFKLRCIHCHVDNDYPGGSFFEAEDRYKWILLWTATGIAGFFFLSGIFFKLGVWRQGRRSHRPDEYDPLTLRRFFTGILQLDLKRISLPRWVNYMLLSFSFVTLMGVMLIVYGLALGTDARTFTLPDPLGAGVNLVVDLLGLFILAGVLLGVLRRLPPWKNKYLAGAVTDAVSLGLIAVLVLTGFLLESFRIASFPVRAEQFYSVVGATLALGLRKISLPWTVYHFYLWNIHVLIALFFIAYIPWSGFFHIMTCPVTQTTSRKKEERIRLFGYGRGRVKSGEG